MIMLTSEEAQDWLAHQLLDGGTLAHHGVLGMHWGQRRVVPSGISSYNIDRKARIDAKSHTELHADRSNDREAKANRARITSLVKRRSDANPDYAKAYAYHKPKQERNLKIKQGVATGLVTTGAVAYFAYAHGDFAKRALTSVALKVAAARGAKAAVPILKAIGNKPVAAMAQGLDGVWRLAA